MRLLWRFTWWRVIVVFIVRISPAVFSNWLGYRSGLTEGLEGYFRETGDLAMVQETRALRRRMESLYGP